MSIHLRKIIQAQREELDSLENKVVALTGIIENLHARIFALESELDFEILHKTKAEIELKMAGLESPFQYE